MKLFSVYARYRDPEQYAQDIIRHDIQPKEGDVPLRFEVDAEDEGEAMSKAALWIGLNLGSGFVDNVEPLEVDDGWEHYAGDESDVRG